MLKNIFDWFVKSSADPEKISLSLKSLAPFVLSLAIFFNVDITDGDFDKFVVAVVGVLSGLSFLFGFGRKIVNSFSKE